jgi:hypothetical protein
MIIVCQFIKDWYINNNRMGSESLYSLMDELKTELDKE